MINSHLKSHVSRLYSSGFTLVELLVAISILSLAILATFTAISNNIRGANFAAEQTTAYFLADEGIEYVRNLRDQNGIANIHAYATGGSVNWLTGIANVSSDPCYPGKFCVVDSPHPSPAVGLAACTGNASTCPYLRKDTVSGLYGYTASWPVTEFQRVVQVSVSSTTEAVVTCTVSWTINNISKSYSVSEIIKDWQ